MTPAVITLAFDPTLHLGWLAVRWETLGLGVAFSLALAAAALTVLREPSGSSLRRLRLDDLLYLVMAAVPGAVVGGRLVYALDYLDYYRAQPEALVDPARGSLSLLGAVVGGTLTAVYMARLLDVPARRWLDALSIPLLAAIGLGKAAQLLGGGGQGAAFGGAWAVAFHGAGPWLSPTPSVPAHPSQLYEALWAIAGIPLVLLAGRAARGLPGFTRQVGDWAARQQARGREVAEGSLRFGYLFLFALQWWLVGRVLVGFTWRDALAAAGLGVEQLAALGVLVASVLLGVAWALPARGQASAPDPREGLGAAPPVPKLDRLDGTGRD